jgi:hypothetical protein
MRKGGLKSVKRLLNIGYEKALQTECVKIGGRQEA